MSVPGVWSLTNWNQSLWTTSTTANVPIVASLSELQQAIADIIKDTSVTDADIDGFIGKAHFKIERDLMSNNYGRAIPHQMLVRGESTTDAQSGVPLPPNYLKTRHISVNGLPARYNSPENVETAAPGLGSAPVVLDYYERLLQLSEANPTNWLLDAAADVYIYGACLQYVPWAKEWDMLPLWTPFYEDAIKGVKQTYAPQPLGSFVRNKSNRWTYLYTIVGSTILFASTWRRSAAARYGM